MVLPAVVAACGDTAGPRPARPDTPGPDWQAFDADLRQRAANGLFSGVVLVAEGDRVVLGEGYGIADRDHGIAMTQTAAFCIASMGKMFTAVAVAQLVERHEVAFTDTLGRFVTGFPAEIGTTVTVHQLLTHTSGMGDALERGTTEPPTSLAGLLAQIEREPLQFAPGSRFAYSNSGFIVLGAIIEKVTGQTYADVIADRIAAPAGMTTTAVATYRPTDVPGMAHGYFCVDASGAPIPPGPVPAQGAPSDLRDNSAEPQVGNPSGGAYSTAADMLAFARALTGHRLLGQPMTDTVLAGKVAAQRPGGPPDDRYAYGFDDQQVGGVRIVGHNGGTPGYEGQLDIYPDRGVTVVMLTNQDGVLVPVIRRSEALVTGQA